MFFFVCVCTLNFIFACLLSPRLQRTWIPNWLLLLLLTTCITLKRSWWEDLLHVSTVFHFIFYFIFNKKIIMQELTPPKDFAKKVEVVQSLIGEYVRKMKQVLFEVAKEEMPYKLEQKRFNQEFDKITNVRIHFWCCVCVCCVCCVCWTTFTSDYCNHFIIMIISCQFLVIPRRCVFKLQEKPARGRQHRDPGKCVVMMRVT